eukprot:snap_masked-scaffold_4-processed-gene-21.21-mRNA-1 protein AED:1.00 eAED:1.00 QI:0/-1/0/0/-1/1/1/0/60
MTPMGEVKTIIEMRNLILPVTALLLDHSIVSSLLSLDVLTEAVIDKKRTRDYIFKNKKLL